MQNYELYNHRHAAELLATGYPDELADITTALLQFKITQQDILDPGGNESGITRAFQELLRPEGWLATRVSADLMVRRATSRDRGTRKNFVEDPNRKVREGYLDGHEIDFVKGRVALDWEWNSKDQTFDRDLFAFRAFHECDVISCGVLVTRSAALNAVFEHLAVKGKYGASTTWLGKLIPRLEAGRSGGCPIRAVGITPKQISDWGPM